MIHSEGVKLANVKFCFVIKVHIIANCIREEGAVDRRKTVLSAYSIESGIDVREEKQVK